MADMARLWNDYNAYWHEVSKKSEVPVFFFRFEDLLTDPKHLLTETFKFLLGNDGPSLTSLEGTYIEHRIDEVLKLGA